MQAISKLKYSLTFNQSLDNIINILKIATSIQLRQFQAKSWEQQSFISEINKSLAFLSAEEVSKHQFVAREKQSPKGVVVITSDEGFLGELNTLLVNAGIAEKNSEQDVLVIIGAKGAQSLREMKQNHLYFSQVKGETYFNESHKLKQYITQEYLKKRFNQIVIIYAEFISITAQRVRRQTLLPFPITELKGIEKREKESNKTLLIEPSVESIIEGLISLNLDYSLRRILYSSKLSEFAARLMHLERSYQELSRKNKQLSLEYFKSLHALADKRIREISASRMLKKKS
ncbi:MAG: FoF1 ATP synthase subunit gamma [Candidatus Omnitrophota bacterium]